MVNPNDIKNKVKRSDVVAKQKAEKNKEKLQRRMCQRKEEKANPELKEERLRENVPATIENQRTYDETKVDAEDEEVAAEEADDEFSGYFTQGNNPKVMVTTCRGFSAKGYAFAKEFTSVFPRATFVKRNNRRTVQETVARAKEKGFTTVCLLNEDRKKMNAVTFINIPDGPTMLFKLTSTVLSEDIRGHAKVQGHNPELILNNFNTRLGHTVGRQLASMFPHVPQFKGRQAVTFHNQRDFIFLRRHRYIFNDKGERCDLQEIGPRFTLKLQSVQKGTYDPDNAEYEWVRKPDQDGRTKFFL